MALRPGILLQGRVADVSQSIPNALLTFQRAKALKTQSEQQPARNRLLEAQAGTAEQGQIQATQENRIRSVATAALELLPVLNTNNPDAVRASLLKRKTQLVEQGINTEDTDEALAMLDQPGGLELLKGSLNDAINVGQRMGIIQAPKGQEARPAEEIAFESLIKNFSEDDKKKARKVKAGLLSRAVGSAAQTITEQDIVNEIAQTESTLAGARETGKLGAQLVLKPQIEKLVTIARKKAAAEGDTFTDLARSKAALPGLKDTVSQLRDLALIATSTLGGRVFDTAVKELGFGATKGKTARSKFIAIINNQVLPLLKLTFGGSFSVQEGQELKATMGDPDSSPEEKLAQLDAFIAQKERDIATKSLELGSFGGNLNDLSDDDLLNF